MSSKHRGLRRFVYVITFSILCILVYSSSIGVAFGQKMPNALKLDTNTDDMQYCGTTVTTEFCALYQKYKDGVDLATRNDATADEKKAARNEMIEVVRGQIDTYYKLRKDGRKTKIRWLQTLLDFLEIGTAGAIGIMNGERDKTVTGIALNIFQGGRTAFNKNFEILQTQVLINKMNANRADIFTEIVEKKDSSADDYSWYAAKNDLRRYLFAGTFNAALDSLVTETGAEAGAAEAKLKEVQDQLIVGEVSAEDRTLSRDSNATLVQLGASLGEPTETATTALAALQSIVTELNKDEKLAQLLASNSITAASPGPAIIAALRKLRRELTVVNNTGLVNKINKTIIDLGN